MKLIIIFLLSVQTIFIFACEEKYDYPSKKELERSVESIKSTNVEDRKLINDALARILEYQRSFQLTEDHLTRKVISDLISREKKLISNLKMEIKYSEGLIESMTITKKKKILTESQCRKDMILDILDMTSEVMDSNKICEQTNKFQELNFICGIKVHQNSLNIDRVLSCAQATSLSSSFIYCLDLAVHLSQHDILNCGAMVSQDDFKFCLEKKI